MNLEIFIKKHPSEPNIGFIDRLIDDVKLDLKLVSDDLGYWALLSQIDVALSISSTSLIDWMLVKSLTLETMDRPIYCFTDNETIIWHKTNKVFSSDVFCELGVLATSKDEVTRNFSDALAGKAVKVNRFQIREKIADLSLDQQYFLNKLKRAIG